jgi:hypothetical protein
MKSIATSCIVLLVVTSPVFAQSESYRMLKDRFSGRHDVFSFRTSGFFARSILRIAGEHEFTRAISDVRNIRLTVIPKKAFRQEGVTVNGFIKVAKSDSFEELVHVRDHGDDVTVLLQGSGKGIDNRYLLLVDNDDEVVAIEIRGYIDPDLINARDNDKIAFYN